MHDDIVGSKGVLLFVDKKKKNLLQAAVVSPASPRKFHIWIGPIASLVRCLTLNSFQLQCLLLEGMSINKTFSVGCIPVQWIDGRVPDGNLMEHCEKKAIECFGGHDIGPAQRCVPFKH